MNARVLLLVLMNALFMAAWTGDQTAIQASLARRSQARAALVATLVVQQPPANRVASAGKVSAVSGLDDDGDSEAKATEQRVVPNHEFPQSVSLKLKFGQSVFEFRYSMSHSLPGSRFSAVSQALQ